MARKEKSEYIIQAVSHALDLLEQFHDDVDELGVTELSKRLKLHKNNVFRLLATLESRGYIEQNKATENYRLGLKALELGQTFIKQMGLLREGLGEEAEAELIALDASADGFCVVAIRPHLVWGPRDPHFLPRLYERRKKGLLRLPGGGEYLVDTIYVDNAARAHLQVQGGGQSGQDHHAEHLLHPGGCGPVRVRQRIGDGPEWKYHRCHE